jgi:predicted DNA binding CopG/RHH family protein
MKRKVPKMTTDEEAEAFLEQDLSDLDFSQFKPMKFEFQAKAARLNMPLPLLLDAVKARAKGGAFAAPGLSVRFWSGQWRRSRTRHGAKMTIGRIFRVGEAAIVLRPC